MKTNIKELAKEVEKIRQENIKVYIMREHLIKGINKAIAEWREYNV